MLKDQDIECLVDALSKDRNTNIDNLLAANVTVLLEIKKKIKDLISMVSVISGDDEGDDITVNVDLSELITRLEDGIIIYQNDNRHYGSLIGSEGYALSSADIGESVSVMFGTNSYLSIAKERILKYEKVASIGGTDAEPHVISAFKGVRTDEIDGLLNYEIRNTSIHRSEIANDTTFSIVTLHVENTLDQAVTIQIKGNILSSLNGAVDMGSSFTVAPSDFEARTIVVASDGWMPYIYFEASCSTAPTSGNITGKFVMRT